MTALILIAALLVWALVVVAANPEPRCDHRLEPDMDEESGIYFHSCRCGERVGP